MNTTLTWKDGDFVHRIIEHEDHRWRWMLSNGIEMYIFFLSDVQYRSIKLLVERSGFPTMPPEETVR